MSDSSSDPNTPRSSFQTEAQRLAEAARERAADAFEEIKVNSNQLVDKVRELIEEGNVRRISIRKGEKTLFEIPLTVGAGAAAAAVLFTPLLAGIGAVAALVSEITLVIERDEAGAGGASGDASSESTSGSKSSSTSGTSGQTVGDAGSGSTGTSSSSGSGGGSDSGSSKTVGRSGDSGSGNSGSGSSGSGSSGSGSSGSGSSGSGS